MSLRLHNRLVHQVFIWLGCLMLSAPALAVPVYPGAPSGGSVNGVEPGALTLTGSSQTRMRFDVLNQSSRLANYTFGFFDLSQMTARVNDPDFALQALQADRVILLHQAGQILDSRYEVSVNSNARIGVFLLRDATLADFSRGRNAYQPIFSLSGAPGSNLVQLDDGALWGGTVFSFDTFDSGAVMGGGAGADPGDELSIGVFGHKFSLDQVDQHYAETVVPEPATLALCGLGLASLAALRRRFCRQ